MFSDCSTITSYFFYIWSFLFFVLGVLEQCLPNCDDAILLPQYVLLDPVFHKKTVNLFVSIFHTVNSVFILQTLLKKVISAVLNKNQKLILSNYPISQKSYIGHFQHIIFYLFVSQNIIIFSFNKLKFCILIRVK